MSWTYNCEPKLTHLKYTILDTINDVDSINWNVLSENNIYLTTDYLESLEESLNDKLDFKYIQFYDNDNEVVGITYLQIVSIKEVSDNSDNLISRIGAQIKNRILGVLDFRILVCGNIFANGENGFLFNKSITSEVVYDNISNIVFHIRKSEDEENQPSVVIIKEFWPASVNASDHLKTYEFREFMIDVNMVLAIHPTWNSIDDYLNSMNTKFRTKAKSCFKKSHNVIVKELDVNTIKINLPRIEELYSNVVEHANFNFSKLNGKAFLNFKTRLGDKYIINGFYLNGVLIGFSTSFINNDVIDAGYVGLDYDNNHQYAVYQKILYNYVQQGIDNKSKEVRFGRTAEEIKSTLGAIPINMKLYARHRNSLSNKIIKPIIESISPSEFEVRKPFKTSFLNT